MSTEDYLKDATIQKLEAERKAIYKKFEDDVNKNLNDIYIRKRQIDTEEMEKLKGK